MTQVQIIQIQLEFLKELEGNYFLNRMLNFEKRSSQVCLKIQSPQHPVKLKIQLGIAPLIYLMILKINMKNSNKVMHQKLNQKMFVFQAGPETHN